MSHLNKKGADFRPLNFLISLFILIIIIVIFYSFLSIQIVTSERIIIESETGSLRTDRALAEWTAENEELSASSGALENSLNSWFSSKEMNTIAMCSFEGQKICNIHARDVPGFKQKERTVFFPTDKGRASFSRIKFIISGAKNE